MSLPLSGIRVIDFATVLAGPFAAMLLADQGADVVKIESPEGDSARRLQPNYPQTKGLSLGFISFNRNKRSVVVDITRPGGIDVVYDLLRWADVLVINMRVNTRKRRGLTYERVAAVNPRLIYASITGYGENGPDADLPGADITIQGRVGDILERSPDGGPPPEYTHLYHFDMATAMLGAYSVMLALKQREATGHGQEINLNLLQSALACQNVQMTQRIGSDGRYAIKAGPLPNQYQGSDGRWLLSQSINVGARWDEFPKAIGLDYLITDPRFNTQQKREQRVGEIKNILTKHFATRPAADWVAMFKARSMTATMVQSLVEVYDDPQVVNNDMIVQFEQTQLGAVRSTGLPFRMAESAGEAWLRRPAPTLGEHTEEVLAQLGYNGDRLHALKAEKVVI